MQFSQFSHRAMSCVLPSISTCDNPNAIDLAIAEPELSPPYQVIEALERHMRDDRCNKYLPGNGVLSLREHIAAWATKDYGFNVTADNIAITSGVRGGVACVFRAYLNPNDEVILLAPYWTNYLAMIHLTGAVPKIVTLDEEEGFFPIIDQLEKATCSRTKMIILNNPHNPTGVIWDKKTLTEILQWAEKKNIFVLADEINATEIFDGNEFTHMAQITKSFKNLAIVRSISKSIAAPGWGLGWLIGSTELINIVSVLQKSLHGGAHSTTQYALVDVWNCIEPWLAEQCLIHQERRDSIYEQLLKIHGFRTTKPQGGLCEFTNIKYYLGNKVGGEVPQTSSDFVNIVYQQTGVLLTCGQSLGLDGFVRFCHTKDPQILQEAVSRISSILEK